MTARKKGPHGGRRHGLSPDGESGSIIVRVSPDDRAGLEELVRLFSDGSGRPWTMSEVVRQLIRDEVRTHRREMAQAPELIRAWTEIMQHSAPPGDDEAE